MGPMTVAVLIPRQVSIVTGDVDRREVLVPGEHTGIDHSHRDPSASRGTHINPFVVQIPDRRGLHKINSVGNLLAGREQVAGRILLDELDVWILGQRGQRGAGQSGGDGIERIKLVVDMAIGLFHQPFGRGLLTGLEADVNTFIRRRQKRAQGERRDQSN